MRASRFALLPNGDEQFRVGFGDTYVVVEKLDKAGVRGLYGTNKRLASSRRARLVEHALAVRLVSSQDLPLFDQHVDDEA